MIIIEKLNSFNHIQFLNRIFVKKIFSSSEYFRSILVIYFYCFKSNYFLATKGICFLFIILTKIIPLLIQFFNIMIIVIIIKIIIIIIIIIIISIRIIIKIKIVITTIRITIIRMLVIIMIMIRLMTMIMMIIITVVVTIKMIHNIILIYDSNIYYYQII